MCLEGISKTTEGYLPKYKAARVYALYPTYHAHVSQCPPDSEVLSVVLFKGTVNHKVFKIHIFDPILTPSWVIDTWVTTTQKKKKKKKKERKIRVKGHLNCIIMGGHLGFWVYANYGFFSGKRKPILITFFAKHLEYPTGLYGAIFFYYYYFVFYL